LSTKIQKPVIIDLNENLSIFNKMPKSWNEFEILLSKLIESRLIYLHFWHLNKIFKEND